jgi:branched-chain amino acid transport system ATP-binding protein
VLSSIISGACVLDISHLVIRYGPVLAVDNLSMHVGEQEIVGVLGPNGAGKSSIVRAVGGLVPVASGSIHFRQRSLLHEPPHKRVALGISVVPEGRGLFPQMSVEENLRMGAYAVRDSDGVRANIERCFSMFPILRERRAQMAGTLSGGQQQMLAVSVGLMSDPTLLVLDEPTLGLAPVVIEEIGRALRRFREMRLAVLLIEQNATLTCAVADRIYVVSGGRIRIEDKAGAILQSPELVEELI